MGTLRYSPALDGIRAVAVLAVVAFHAKAPFAAGGWLGVDVFFVLSGYLITRLLMAEIEAQGRIDVPRFYMRRLLRLYPTMVLMLAAFLLVAPRLLPDIPAAREAALTALYLSDYSLAFWRTPVVLMHTWSLAVEEHFYLLWPLVLPAVLRARRPLVVLLAAYAAATLWRVVNLYWLGWDATYFRFDTRLSGLIFGCMLPFVRFDLARYRMLGWLALAALLLTVTIRQTPALILPPLVAEVAAGAVILSASRSHAHAFLGSAPMAYLGKLSYGIYLWHLPPLYWCWTQGYPWQTNVVVSLGLALPLAAASYHLLDVPMQRVRRRWRAPVSSSGTAPSEA